MPKRSAPEAQNLDRARFLKAAKNDGQSVHALPDDCVGEFEDPWEDEVESDEDGDKNQDEGWFPLCCDLLKWLLTMFIAT